MSFKTIVGILVLGLFTFESCKKAEENPVAQSGEKDNTGVWRLKTGATFKYNSTVYDTSGSVVSSTSITKTILSDSTIQNEKWYKLSDSPIYYYRNKTGGLYRIEVRGTLVTGPYLLYKYPTALSDKYMSNTDSVLVENYSTSSLSSDVTITYNFTNNSKLQTVVRIPSGQCPDVINTIGYTKSGRQYTSSSLFLTQADWPK